MIVFDDKNNAIILKLKYCYGEDKHANCFIFNTLEV